MDLKPGYKQTEVGVIPEDWDLRTLKGLAAISHGFGFQSRYFTDRGKYRLTTPGHFHDTGGFRDVGEKQKYYAGPLPEGYLLSEGDLIVAMTEQADGLLGSAALVPIAGTYLHNQRLGKVKPLSPDVSIGFLYRVFNWPLYRAKVRETAAGTKVKHTSPGRLLEIAVPIPHTKLEQEAIAEALSDADGLIESIEQLLDKKRQLKQGAVQELVTGKTRLPGFKEKWEVKTVGELGACFPGGTPSTSRSEYWGGDICWLPSGRVQNCILDSALDGDTRITKRGLDESAARIIKAGSVLIAITGATCANVASLEFEAAANQSVIAIEPLSFVNHRFLYYSLLLARNTILSMQSGSAQGGVNLKTVRSLSLSLPSFAEQTVIAATISDMDSEIAALEAKLVKARNVKQGMMQELLTGRTRLVETL